MCGIIGYVGERKASDVLLSGLSKLEYRGYDSAGIATLDGGRIDMLKTVGKLGALSRALQETRLDGSIGLGHTRWATHGEPTRENAHPHTDCSGRIALVHNGIIENYASLRGVLEGRGHVFKSRTDSEVLAHLVEEYLKDEPALEEALRKALNSVTGSYAVCLMHGDRPQELVAARNGSPLVIGVGRGENFAASDPSAILNYTRDIAFLGDYQIARITRDAFHVTSLAGQRVTVEPKLCSWDSQQTEKGSYPHYMLKEIHEQPRVMHDLLDRAGGGELNGELFGQIGLSVPELASVKRVIILACGTSWHAGLAGKRLLETLARVSVEVDVASEFRYRNPIIEPGTLVIGISQSGETADTLGCIKQMRAEGVKTLAVCNVPGSSIPRESDGVICTHAGPEIGVASTKCYTAQLMALTLLALRLGSLKGVLDAEQAKALAGDLWAIPEKMQKVLDDPAAVLACADAFAGARDFLFLARGINIPTAFEGALKIKEIAYVHATGHPAGEMKHGPIALIDRQMPVICIATGASTHEKIVSNMQEAWARGGRVAAVCDAGDGQIGQHAERLIPVPAAHELFTPLLAVIPLQLLAYHVAVKRGCDVDQPRNLAKSVTVE